MIGLEVATSHLSSQAVGTASGETAVMTGVSGADEFKASFLAIGAEQPQIGSKASLASVPPATVTTLVDEQPGIVKENVTSVAVAQVTTCRAQSLAGKLLQSETVESTNSSSATRTLLANPPPISQSVNAADSTAIARTAGSARENLGRPLGSNLSHPLLDVATSGGETIPSLCEEAFNQQTTPAIAKLVATKGSILASPVDLTEKSPLLLIPNLPTQTNAMRGFPQSEDVKNKLLSISTCEARTKNVHKQLDGKPGSLQPHSHTLRAINPNELFLSLQPLASMSIPLTESAPKPKNTVGDLAVASAPTNPGASEKLLASDQQPLSTNLDSAAAKTDVISQGALRDHGVEVGVTEAEYPSVFLSEEQIQGARSESLREDTTAITQTSGPGVRVSSAFTVASSNIASDATPLFPSHSMHGVQKLEQTITPSSTTGANSTRHVQSDPYLAPQSPLRSTPNSLEIGISSGAQGWLKVRAEVHGENVSATISSTSESGTKLLHEQLPSLTAFLSTQNISVATSVLPRVVIESESRSFSRQYSQEGGSGHQPSQQQSQGQPLELNHSTPPTKKSLSPEDIIASVLSSQPALLHGSGAWLNVLA